MVYCHDAYIFYNLAMDELERREIEGKFAASAESSFGSDLVLGISSGSFAYCGAVKGKSDIDILLILRESVRHIPKEKLISKVKTFIESYFAIHREHGFSPDGLFPAEYLTIENVKDAISGRGFHACAEGTLYLPPASDEYYLQDREHYYRAWASMLAFSRRIIGDSTIFEEVKLEAWETIIAFLLLSFGENEEITPSLLLDVLTSTDDKWRGVGVTNRCLSFRQDEYLYVELALNRLRIKGLIEFGDDQTLRVTTLIQEWGKEVKNQIDSRAIRNSAFLFDEEVELELTRFSKALLHEQPK